MRPESQTTEDRSVSGFDLSLEELREIAVQLGLVRLSDEHLAELARAMRAARSWEAGLPEVPSIDLEPAHVFWIGRLPDD